MWMGRIRRTFTATAAVVVLAGLGNISQASATSVLPASSGSPSVAPAACRPPSLADCYTKATMLSYLRLVQPMVAKFFRAEYKAMPPPRHYIYISEAGGPVVAECRDENGSYLMSSTAYAYCPVDQNIYLGQTMMWHFYSQDGDAAPVIGLAHEWGHNVQTQVGVPAPSTPAQTVIYEDQADCVAGAWIRYAISQGWIERRDITSTERLLIDIQDAERRSHGTLAERTRSLAIGIQSGLAACNAFYPGTPIYT